MREIKLRAWIKTGIETYDYVKPMTIQQMVHSKKSTFSLKQLNDLVDFEQFTGLKDVNGNDIYEGDIMRAVPVRRQYPTAFSLKEHVGTLVIGSQRLTISGKTYDKELYDYEVIGNKFENPELLEEKK